MLFVESIDIQAHMIISSYNILYMIGTDAGDGVAALLIAFYSRTNFIARIHMDHITLYPKAQYSVRETRQRWG
jgi:hypothetical protein